jgi:hypothetical protein
MNLEQTGICLTCGAAKPFGKSICRDCGALDSRVVRICPECTELFPAALSFCPADGNALLEPVSTAQVGDPSSATIASDQTIEDEGLTTDVATRMTRFWKRHLILNCLTIVAAGAWAAFFLLEAEGWALLAIALTGPLLVSWPIGMSSGQGALDFVSRIDSWYFRLFGYFSNSSGKIRRWIMYPVIWSGGRWALFANRQGDQFVAASLRLFGYVSALMLVVSLAIIVAYIVIALFIIGLALWFLSMMFGGDAPDIGRIRKVPMVGRRGQELYEGHGGWFDAEKRVGRVDDQGNVYEGGGGWFDVERRIGRIGSDGRVFEGGGGFFDTEQQVGKIGPGGEVYETDGGIFSPDVRMGRIGDDGEIFEGKGGFLDVDKRVGKAKRD